MNLPEVRRKEGKGILRGGTVEAVSFSAIAAHPHGDTGSARDFCLDLDFAAFSEDDKVCTFDNNRLARSLFRAGRRARGFSATFVFYFFCQPRGPILDRLDPGLAGPFSNRLFWELEPGRQVLRGREE